MKNILVFLTLFVTVSLYGQSVSLHQIKSSGDYIYAEGTGLTLEEADKDAFAQLSRSSALVSHMATYSTDDRMGTDGNSSDSHYSDNTSIMSSLYLQNVHRYELPDQNGRKRVLRYIHKSDWEQRYDVCKSRIEANVESAMIAEQDYDNIDDAIMYYSWALALLRSYPENDLVVEGVKGGIPQYCTSAIKRILAGIEINVTDVQDMSDKPNTLFPYIVGLDFMYNGEPVPFLSFSYYNGEEYVDGAQVKDGRSVVELRRRIDNIKIDIDCLHLDLARDNQTDVYTILTTPGFPPQFEGEIIDVEVKSETSEKASGFEMTAEALKSAVDNSLKMTVATHKPVKTEITDYTEYENVMKSIARSINESNPDKVRDLFTEEGWEDFTMIVTSGNPVIIRTPEYRFLQMDSLLMCRSIPMKLTFSGNKAFVEDVTFRLNINSGKIQSVAYTLSSSAEARIMSMDWEDKGRLTLINFLEDYRTAYCLKDINYIQKIFSDDAYIIVGTELKTGTVKTTDQITLNIPENTVVYQTKTKKEYIADLRRSFRSKEFVNIRFGECSPAKGYQEKEGIYAVQLKQRYYSNNYSDEGYLTLAIDMRDEDNPLVKVRVWQKDRNEEYTAETMIDRTISTGAGIY